MSGKQGTSKRSKSSRRKSNTKGSLTKIKRRAGRRKRKTVIDDCGGCTFRSQLPDEHRCITKIQIRWTKRMQRRKVYMEELKDIRDNERKERFKSMVKSVGPRWFHDFSGNQRKALDGFVAALRNDRFEGVPWRTMKILSKIGVYPLPHLIDMKSAVYVADCDTSKFFAYIYLAEFNCPFFAERKSYDLKTRLLLSAMYYTGAAEIFKSFKVIFAPDKVPGEKKKKNKVKFETTETEKCESPYLENFKLIHAPVKKPKPKNKPAPLPKNLKCINKTKWQDAPPEDEVRIPPPPLPPPPPPKRLPREYCDKVGALNRELAPKFPPLYKYVEPPPVKRGVDIPIPHREKKLYGLRLFGDAGRPPRIMRKPKMPKTGVEGWYHHIVGVYIVKKKKYFILANICSSPIQGNIINGGLKRTESGSYITVHEGICANCPPNSACEKTCDCLQKFDLQACKVLKKTKCTCGHFYDYKNRGRFHDDQLPYFEKPTPNKSYKFNENVIYEMNDWRTQIQQEVKQFLEDDSVLRIGPKKIRKKRKVKTQTPRKVSRSVQTGTNSGGDMFALYDTEEVFEEDSSSVEEEEIRNPSKTCFGKKPTMMTYIKCAIQYLKDTLLVARLPDVHKVPALKEWMRKRMYGPTTKRQLIFLRQLSLERFKILKEMEMYGYHTKFTLPPSMLKPTNWNKKSALMAQLHNFIKNEYLRKLFGTQAILNNYLWAAMFDHQDPVKNFREAFFAYLPERPGCMQLLHPYCNEEVEAFKLDLTGKRIMCRSIELENFLKSFHSR